MTDQKTLLLVDDEPVNLQVLKNILEADYRLLFARSGERALQLAQQEEPDLILLDVMMPGLSGHDVCQQLKANEQTAALPVIFVTALSDAENESFGFELGAVDYLTKPVSPPVVKARVKNHLSLVRLEELKKTRLAVVQRLGRAAEYKDNETGLHVIRMSLYSQVLAHHLGFSEKDAEELLNAAPMHDVGKIGIPDSILRKPGKLDAEEWEVMKTHTQIGAEIIGEDGSRLLQLAHSIALHHHEKWDGSGYPQGLKGEAIPLEARIVALADVFDALTSERPYKKAWTVEAALDLIQQETGKHFDPRIVEAFNNCLPTILEIRDQWQETRSDS
ncbi:putative two-component system response regulator [Marinospirillum celere]|uniref:Putative two-component system response regulator n=1 Tax=Marinospirillum celere TaxID=1122252 RepID=A0A1I1DT38_9GAMM|nr:two-component system response regulator [Marinospirillum celere]SFB78179.1 putative two-component system response regulator [Marinospirillum celere]